MGKYEELKEGLEKLEEQWRLCNPEKDSAVILKIKEKIVGIMLEINDSTLEYYYKDCFIWMVEHAKVFIRGGAVEIEDVMLKMAEEVWKLYDPEKGKLMPFIITRTALRAQDLLDSKSETLENEISLEGLARNADSRNRQEIVEIILTNQKKGEDVNTPEKRYEISTTSEEAFCDEASNLIRFVNGNDNKRLTIRKLLWTANYSDDVFLAVLSEQVDFNHERDVFEAMNLKFTNHCLEASDSFADVEDISIERLRRGKRRFLADMEWIPQKMAEPVVREGEMIFYPPAGNKVYCGYLAQKENEVRSESTVSVERGKYIEWKKELLGGKDY